MTPRLSLFVPTLMLLGACAQEPVTASIYRTPIVGGTVDARDPAVGAVLIEDGGYVIGICTGSLISPRVVMTAAHCVRLDDPRVPNAAPRKVFFGAQVKGTGTTRNVIKTTYHSSYNGDHIEAGYDIALLLLDAAPPGITPLEINRSAPTTMRGGPLRLVGFGITSGDANDDGTKREVMSTLDEIASSLLWVYSPTKNTCNGDSGGPALLTIGGKEVVAGITSFGDADCVLEGAYSRVDLYAATFIDPWIKANDPSAPTPPVTTPPQPPVTGNNCPTGNCVTGDETDAIPDPAIEGGCSVGGRGGSAGALLVLGALVATRRRRPR